VVFLFNRFGFCLGEEISDEELYEMIEEADRDGDGCLNFAEFYRIMKKREDPLDDFDSDLDWDKNSKI